MRFDRHLIHRCTLIKTGQVTGKDPYNRDLVADVPIFDVPCRSDQIKRRVSSDSNGTDIIVEDILLFGARQDVTEKMKIKNIVDQNDILVLPGVYSIQSIKPVHSRVRLHHYEVTLKKESD